jgi:poly(hydroxyalkanoate) depolymerase family esterase
MRTVRVLAALVVLAAGFAVHDIARAATGTFDSFTFSGAAGSRPYMVYTPAGYATSERVPLVVMLHGCTQSPTDFANGTQMNPLADQRRFVVAYPQQTSAANSSMCWNWFQPANQQRGSGEPAIIAGIAQEVMGRTARWNVDPDRVYVAGMSAGAAMAVLVAADYPDVFAAMGEHSGLEYAAATDLTSATTAQTNGGPDPQAQGQAAFQAMGARARVVPVIAFHGTSDFTVRPVNGDQVTQQWMATDRLASGGAYSASFGSPASTTNGQAPGAQGRAFTVRRWNDASGGEVQEYWTVTGMGHAWSGGSTAGSFTDPNGPSASEAMLAFFFAHPRGGGPAPTPSPSASPTAAPTPTPTPSSLPGPSVTIRLRSIAAEDGSVFQSSSDGPPNAALAYVEVGSTALGHGEVAILSFDTSSIPAGATVVSASLTVTRADAFPFLNDLGPLLVDVAPAAGFSGSNALEQADYGAPAAAAAAASLAPPAGAGASATVSLASGALGAVSRTGHTQLRLRFQKTTNNDAQLDVVHLASGEAGAATAPVLTVTYR